MTQQTGQLDIALVHHPVKNKVGDIIGSAVTNLDLHDIARAARTFGVRNYFVATPYEDQHDLIDEIVGHWLDGYGAQANPARKEALSVIKTAYNVDEVINYVSKKDQKSPLVVATSANKQSNEISYRGLRQHLQEDVSPVLLLFGTAHGMAGEIMKKVDAALPPIYGNSTYNHLSVRSAVSIILDRLLGV